MHPNPARRKARCSTPRYWERSEVPLLQAYSPFVLVLGQPIGSLTQMGRIRLGKRTEKRNPLIQELVPLTALDGLVFGGWDIFGGDMYDACTTAEVIDRSLLDQIKDEFTDD